MDFSRMFPVSADPERSREMVYRGFALVYYGRQSGGRSEQPIGSLRPVSEEAVDAWDARGGLPHMNTSIAQSAEEFFALAMLVVDALFDGDMR